MSTASSSRSLKRRQRWFNVGADQVEKFWPDLQRCYICPTCNPRKGFLSGAIEKKILTDEHATSKRLGGTIVALTCKECNNKAGHAYETHAINREKMLDFALGTADKALRVELNQGGIKVNVDVTATGKNVSVVGLPKYNNPNNQSAWKSRFERFAGTGESNYTINLTFTRNEYDHRLALWSYLRWAYLIGFASFGYSYIYHPKLQVVRNQLAALDEHIIRIYSVISAELDRREKWLMVVREPTELRSLLVRMGRHLVFLPWPASDVDIYRSLLERPQANKEFLATLNGSFLTWPK